MTDLSIGILDCRGGHTVGEYLNEVDGLLYEGKTAGRNQLVVGYDGREPK